MKTHINIKISESKEKRRQILESARALTVMLRDLTYLDELNRAKRRNMEQVNHLLKHVKTKIRASCLQQVKGLKVKDAPATKKIEEKIRKEELPGINHEHIKLAQELYDIEKKLSSL